MASSRKIRPETIYTPGSGAPIFKTRLIDANVGAWAATAPRKRQPELETRLPTVKKVVYDKSVMEDRMTNSRFSDDEPAFGPEMRVRNYKNSDRSHVFRLLSFLPALYPRSFDWLERRLADIERKRAYCSIALVDEHVAGILIDTPKGLRTSKISTLFVSEEVCGHGVGSLLLQASARRWYDQSVDGIYVTVAGSKQQCIAPFLRSNGFSEAANLPNRYGPGRDELVYSLKLN